MWGPPRPSRPSSAKAVFGGAWTRGVFTGGQEGVHFQFLSPGERVCTPRLSQNASADCAAFEQIAQRHDDDLIIQFGDICEGFYDSDLLGFQSPSVFYER
ncbi:hypothetical protein FGB62_14g235 [Gracilaria domingensis]|nr:hypothetical protein FGB62_14g235 [Gracilaria domingensis]